MRKNRNILSKAFGPRHIEAHTKKGKAERESLSKVQITFHVIPLSRSSSPETGLSTSEVASGGGGGPNNLLHTSICSLSSPLSQSLIVFF